MSQDGETIRLKVEVSRLRIKLQQVEKRLSEVKVVEAKFMRETAELRRNSCDYQGIKEQCEQGTLATQAETEAIAGELEKLSEEDAKVHPHRPFGRPTILCACV